MQIDDPESCVSVELLDSDQAYTVQTWTFDSQDVIRIGRSHEGDVMISNPYVSREHAELRFSADRWSTPEPSPRPI